jgi:DNA invertase Pin-like site-specific DNA recombinase
LLAEELAEPVARRTVTAIPYRYRINDIVTFEWFGAAGLATITMEIGYARVSTLQQDTSLQRAAFERAGITIVIEEKKSGAGARPALERLLAELQPGDQLVVYKLDRLARSLVDLMRILARVEAAGATFRSLTEALETVTPVGRMLIQMLGAIAEFERALIRERCAAGRAEAVRRGVRFGSPPRLCRKQAIELRSQGLTWLQVAERLGCSENTARLVASGRRVSDGGEGVDAPAPKRLLPKPSSDPCLVRRIARKGRGAAPAGPTT